MSGSEEDPMLLAAEYALGSLDLSQIREAEALALRDPAFAREIAHWEDRLAALGELVPPVQPPASLWARLALATGAQRTRRRGGFGFWQGSTAASLALAAGLAMFVYWHREPPHDVGLGPFAAALGPLASPARFLVQMERGGTIAITSLVDTPAPAGRDYQLWALPQGSAVPASLGVLQPGSRTLAPPQRLTSQEQLLVSEEPAGGSPTGAPTGAVVFGGKLVPLSPQSAPGP